MGLFDYITFEDIIPGRPANSQFQTKSFDNFLEHYVVTRKGEIYRKIPNTSNREYLTDYHGDVIFYDDIIEDEFIARFTDGKLTRVSFKTRERLNGEILQERSASGEQDIRERSEQ